MMAARTFAARVDRSGGNRLPPRFDVPSLLDAVGLLVNGVYHGPWPSAGLNSMRPIVGSAWGLWFMASWRASGLPNRVVRGLTLKLRPGGGWGSHLPARG